jgi:hypothetical protein
MEHIGEFSTQPHTEDFTSRYREIRKARAEADAQRLRRKQGLEDPRSIAAALCTARDTAKALRQAIPSDEMPYRLALLHVPYQWEAAKLEMVSLERHYLVLSLGKQRMLLSGPGLPGSLLFPELLAKTIQATTGTFTGSPMAAIFQAPLNMGAPYVATESVSSDYSVDITAIPADATITEAHWEHLACSPIPDWEPAQETQAEPQAALTIDLPGGTSTRNSDGTGSLPNIPCDSWLQGQLGDVDHILHFTMTCTVSGWLIATPHGVNWDYPVLVATWTTC